MDAEFAPSRAFPARLRSALGAIRGACSHAAKFALDIALPTLCVSCREPVEGEGVCAKCWSKLSFIEPPYCPRLGIPFVYDPGPDMLIPVPLHWRRAWHRRFNQSGALGRAIERQAGVALRGDVLRRVRPTEQQVGLSRAQRASNVQGAFEVSADAKSQIAGRRLVLIDDVLTSGATLDACARALLRAKAAQVDVLVFARVVDGPKAPI